MEKKMKLIILLVFLAGSALAAVADDYVDRQIIRIDVAEFPSHKVCIFRNELYSEGSEIKMESQKFYRCERYQEGKTAHKETLQLKWIAISPSN
jgi:hypothetical protein